MAEATMARPTPTSAGRLGSHEASCMLYIP